MAHRVIVGVDDGPGIGDVVDWAADESQSRGVRLHLAHAWLPQPFDTPEGQGNAQDRRAGERVLQELAQRATARHPALQVSSEIIEDGPRDALASLSATAGLLVLGSRGSGGFPGLLVGSTSLHLAAGADCPVVVVPYRAGRADAGAARGGVAVGVRGKAPSDELLSFAFAAAQRRQLPLLVVHSWHNPIMGHGHALPPVYEQGHIAAEETRLLAEILAGWRQKYPDVPVEEDIVRSGPAKHLVELSATQQLLVVGRHGIPEGLVHRLGSVSQAVVHYSQCPVAVLPEG